MLVLHDNDGLEPDLKDELEQGFLSSQFGKPLLLKTSQELRMLSSVRKQRLSSIQVLNCQNSNQNSKNSNQNSKKFQKVPKKFPKNP